MNDKYFIDTNIFVYILDKRQPEKQKRALELIAEALESGNGMISFQVVQEFLNVATHKFSNTMTFEEAKEFLQKILYPFCVIFPDLFLYNSALEIAGRTSYTFYDSLILAAANRGGCAILYSEDLQSNQQVENVRIVNPFA